MPQITSITSEALQATIRRLLPSQQGFGEDLQATNLITPIIDLTPSAEGSTTPPYLLQALAFGSQTSTAIVGTTATLVNTPGFFRVFGSFALRADSGGNRTADISLSDGLSSKKILVAIANFATTTDYNESLFDFIVFLRAGDSLTGTTNSSDANLDVTTRQIADVNGNLVAPVGFIPT